jgi:hypothetical protein
MTSEFKAPLSGRIKATSLLGTVVLLGEGTLMLTLSAHVPQPVAAIFFPVGVCLLALFPCVALVAIRGYSLENGALRVARPLWSTTYSLAGLTSVVRDPKSLRFTFYGFGNNGFFALNGWRNVEPYGWCRVLATDPENAVVLRAAERTYIVTPDRPDEFVQQALALARPVS